MNPLRVESTLNAHKSKFIGHLPGNRDDYEPSSILSKLESGSKVLVLDSSKHLPEGWQNISLQDLFPEENIDTDNVPSSDGGNSESDGCETPIHQNDSFNFDEMRMLEALHDNESDTSNCSETDVGLPSRVLVYTTLSLLGLLAVARKASVDGTFKVCYA